jgi:hypothetical protein
MDYAVFVTLLLGFIPTRPTKMVYFLQGGSTKLVKIGKTADLEERLRALQASSPDRLTVLATIPDALDDAPYHFQFRESWAGHGEWFTPSPDLMAFIETLPQSSIAPCTVGNHNLKRSRPPRIHRAAQPRRPVVAPPLQQPDREWLAERVLENTNAAKPGSNVQAQCMNLYARLRGWKPPRKCRELAPLKPLRPLRSFTFKATGDSR